MILKAGGTIREVEHLSPLTEYETAILFPVIIGLPSTILLGLPSPRAVPVLVPHLLDH